MDLTRLENSFRLTEWIQSTAAIVGAMGQADLHHQVGRSLSTFIRHDDSKQFMFREGDAPALVYNSTPGAPNPMAIGRYLGRSYELNPFFRRYRRGQAFGVHRMRDIAERNLTKSDVAEFPITLDSREEIGYLTDGYPPRTEELCVGIPIGADRCLAISLSREKSSQGFSDDELARARLIAPFLTSVFNQALFPRVERVMLPASDGGGRAACVEKLTAREKQVTVLLLKGHSSLSISMHLGIGLTTVKTHRKNIYAKLRIATLAELFSTVTLEGLCG